MVVWGGWGLQLRWARAEVVGDVGWLRRRRLHGRPAYAYAPAWDGPQARPQPATEGCSYVTQPAADQAAWTPRQRRRAGGGVCAGYAWPSGARALFCGSFRGRSPCAAS
eukprot:352360-Chlamydomonas_euryale.AAC.2